MADAVSTESIPTAVEPSVSRVARSRPRSKLRRFGAWLVAPESRVLVYLGLAILVGGFGLIAFAWSKIASTVSVPLQLPYVASGGFIGLGLIVVGVGVVSIGVKRRNNFARVREIEKLSATMKSIHKSIDESAEDSDVDGF